MSKQTARFGILIAAAALAVAGCNGSGSNGTTPDISGIYSGAAVISAGGNAQASIAVGAVAQDGNGYFIAVDSSGDTQLLAYDDLAGIGKVTSSQHEVPAEGSSISRGPETWQFKIKAVDASQTTFGLQGTFTGNGGNSLTVATASNTHAKGLHAGNYQGQDVNRLTAVTATLGADGKLSGLDGLGCHLAGTLTQEGSLNLFDVSVAITGPASCHGTLTGLAFFDTQDWTGQFSGAHGTFLYLLGANSDFSHGFAMALRLQ